MAPLAALLLLLALCAPHASASPDEQLSPQTPAGAPIVPDGDATDIKTNLDDHGAHEGEHHDEARPVFVPEHGTWFNLPARTIFASPEEKQHMAEAEERVKKAKARVERNDTLTADEIAVLAKQERIREAGSGATEKLTPEEKKLAEDAATLQALQAKKQGKELSAEQYELTSVHYVTNYDWLLYTPLIWGLTALLFIGAARKSRIRPEGKGHSTGNLLEAAVEAFQDYLIGVMGGDLARKYTPLIASFFFTILFMNWLGLVPGMLSPSAQPAIPIAMALVGFVAVHFIAIKESGFKPWFMHFVGEPKWMAPLNLPLHLVGELFKPLSLSLRLLCNIFGEEAVVATLAFLALTSLPAWLPIPFQFPMLVLGTFFSFLQALVFSTLLAIYLSIFLTHNDDHGHGEDGHVGSHTQHAVDSQGDEHIVGRPTAATVGS